MTPEDLCVECKKGTTKGMTKDSHSDCTRCITEYNKLLHHEVDKKYYGAVQLTPFQLWQLNLITESNSRDVKGGYLFTEEVVSGTLDGDNYSLRFASGKVVTNH